MELETVTSQIFFAAKIYRADVNSREQLDITGMLAAWSKGDEKALADVIPLVYDDLRQIARRHLGRLQAPSVQSGTLAHEAYLKLIHARGIRCNNRAHFFALCSQMIRRILVDHARKEGSAKRGEGLQVRLDEALLGSKARGVEVEALDDAIVCRDRLARGRLVCIAMPRSRCREPG